MKIITLLLMVVWLSDSFASTAAFYYAEGPLKGQKVKSTGYLGYEPYCYKGNPWQARKILKDMASDDIEKDNVRVWYNQNNKNIEFTYVDTKCIEDSQDATEEECTMFIEIPEC